MSFAMTTRVCSVACRTQAVRGCAAKPVAPSVFSRAALTSARRTERGLVTTSALLDFLKGTEEVTDGIYGIQVKEIGGNYMKMSKFAGKVLLVVNVASECGMTPQYSELASLYDKYRKDGFEILGAPCNQFGAQEPKSDAEIKKFAQSKGAKFTMTSKLDVNGPNTDPLYEFLKDAKPGVFGTKDIKWNFTKMLVDREGNVIGRYGPSTTPIQIENDIVKLLNA